MPKYNPYRPNYSNLYPGIEISPAIMEVLKNSDRKMEYMEIDLKREAFHLDQTTETAIFIPSREDSYDRLLEEGKMEFPSDTAEPEDEMLKNDELERLKRALEMLDSDESSLVDALFFKGLSQREYAKSLGLSQAGIHKRWNKVREKLKKILLD